MLPAGDVVAAMALFRVSNALLTIVEGPTTCPNASRAMRSGIIQQHEMAVFEDLDQKSAPGVARGTGSIVANLGQLITVTMRRK